MQVVMQETNWTSWGSVPGGSGVVVDVVVGRGAVVVPAGAVVAVVVAAAGGVVAAGGGVVAVAVVVVLESLPEPSVCAPSWLESDCGGELQAMARPVAAERAIIERIVFFICSGLLGCRPYLATKTDRCRHQAKVPSIVGSSGSNEIAVEAVH
jgi:hypothetical protein